ncbi:hypothetical protein [Mycoplasma sp. 1654_15]|nr:hypothetical protein [Mycoplasma sp. 1654_15]
MKYNLGDKNRPSTPHNNPNGAGYPSTTGNRSGGGRGNNNPRR